MTKLKTITLLAVLFMASTYAVAQTYVEAKKPIPNNDLNQAIGVKGATWYNSGMAPSTSLGYPNQQNWWSVLQMQYANSSNYDAQLAFGLNKQDMYLRYNYDGNWQNWKKIIMGNKDGKVENLNVTNSQMENLEVINSGIRIKQSSDGWENGDVRLNNLPGDTFGFTIRPFDSDFNGGTYNWLQDFGYRNDSKNWYVETDFAIGGTETDGFRLAVNGKTRTKAITIKKGDNYQDGDVTIDNLDGNTYGFTIRPYDKDFEGGRFNWHSDFGYREDSKNWYVETNFGIGTSETQGYKLAVNGSIRAKEVKVESDWADFVFEEDYQLRTLSELDDYIKTNKHLPEIPSASEVKENGIGLSEINTKFLQKIEELTLYTISQQNLIEKQKELISDQKSVYQKLEEKYNDLEKKVDLLMEEINK